MKTNIFKRLIQAITSFFKGSRDEVKIKPLPVVDPVPAPTKVDPPRPIPVPTPMPVPIKYPDPVIEPDPVKVQPLPTPVKQEPVPPVKVETPAPVPPVVKPPVEVPPSNPLPPAHEATLKDCPVKFGVAFKEADLNNKTAIKETVKQFSSVTGENSMKPGHVQPKEGVFDFSQAKALVKIASDNGMRVHAHTCFVWPSQEKNLPAFWHEAAKDKDKYVALLKNSVQTTVRTFKNDITSWDIANEAYEDNGTLRPCYALTHIGPTYIEQIAKWVLEVQPNANNFISDYDFETASKKAGVVIDYAGQLKKKGLVHGISSQMHTNLKMDYKTFKKQLDRMAAAGLLVHLSELDFKVKFTEANEEQRAAKFQEIIKGFRSLPQDLQYGITFWSHTNEGNYYNYKLKPAVYAPVIFDKDYKSPVILPAILSKN